VKDITSNGVLQWGVLGMLIAIIKIFFAYIEVWSRVKRLKEIHTGDSKGEGDSKNHESFQ
jgi:hypothetical protein